MTVSELILYTSEDCNNCTWSNYYWDGSITEVVYDRSTASLISPPDGN